MSSAFKGLPKTPNLKLNKPGYDNVADIEALNENADILDGEIQGIKNTFVKSVNGINAGDDGNVDLGIIPISQGGTGATTAKQARANLEVEPIGTIFAFAGNDIPKGYLPCNGGAISRITYADLFAVIGEIYGAGDGSTTFNLPNLNNNSFLEGSDTVGIVKSAGLPNVVDFFDVSANPNFHLSMNTWGDGALRAQKSYATSFKPDATALNVAGNVVELNLSNANAIYGNSTTVQPKSVTVKFCIKY